MPPSPASPFRRTRSSPNTAPTSPKSPKKRGSHPYDTLALPDSHWVAAPMSFPAAGRQLFSGYSTSTEEGDLTGSEILEHPLLLSPANADAAVGVDGLLRSPHDGMAGLPGIAPSPNDIPEAIQPPPPPPPHHALIPHSLPNGSSIHSLATGSLDEHQAFYPAQSVSYPTALGFGPGSYVVPMPPSSGPHSAATSHHPSAFGGPGHDDDGISPDGLSSGMSSDGDESLDMDEEDYDGQVSNTIELEGGEADGKEAAVRVKEEEGGVAQPPSTDAPPPTIGKAKLTIKATEAKASSAASSSSVAVPRKTISPEHWVHTNSRAMSASLSPRKAEFTEAELRATGGAVGEGTTGGSAATTTPFQLPIHTPRPPNAWILYRSDKLKALANGEKLPGIETLMQMKGESELSSDGESSSHPSSSKGKAKKSKSKAKSKAKTSPSDEPGAEGGNGNGVGSKKIAQADISRLISLMWKKETKQVRTKYDRLAEVRKMQHQAMYPDYKFQPMKKEDKLKLKEERDLMKEKAKEAAKQEKLKLKQEAAAKAKLARRPAPPKKRPSQTASPYVTDRERDSRPTKTDMLPPAIQQGLATEGGFSSNPGANPGPRSRPPVGGKAKKKKASTKPGQMLPPADQSLPWSHEPLVNPGMPAGPIYWGVPPGHELVHPPHQDPIPQFSGFEIGEGAGSMPRQQRYQVVQLGPDQAPPPHHRHQHPQQQQQQQQQGHPQPAFQGLPPPQHIQQYSGPVPGGPGPLPQGWQPVDAGMPVPFQNQGQPMLEQGYAVDQNHAVPFLFEPMPPQPPQHLIIGPEYQHMLGPGELIQNPSEAPVVTHTPYLQNGGFAAHEGIAGVPTNELNEMWDMLQVGGEGDEAIDPTMGDLGAMGDMLNEWAELGGMVVPDLDVMIPTEALSGAVAELASSVWARDSAVALGNPTSQQQQQLQDQPAAGPSQDPMMSYDKPGYLTIQVPYSQLEQAFPGQQPPLRNQGPGQDPFLPAAGPLSPLDGDFGEQQRPIEASAMDGAVPQYASLNLARNTAQDPHQQTFGQQSTGDNQMDLRGRSQYQGFGTDSSRDHSMDVGISSSLHSNTNSAGNSMYEGVYASNPVRFVSASYAMPAEGNQGNPLAGEQLDYAWAPHPEEGEWIGYGMDAERRLSTSNVFQRTSFGNGNQMPYPPLPNGGLPSDAGGWKSQPPMMMAAGNSSQEVLIAGEESSFELGSKARGGSQGGQRGAKRGRVVGRSHVA